VTSVRPPPPGWNPKDVVPQSQQQAQDTLLDYLNRTLAALPEGSVLDASRYGSAGHNSWCDDEPADPKNAHHGFTPSVTSHSRPGPTSTPWSRRVGDTWRSWGWYVYERDGFKSPTIRLRARWLSNADRGCEHTWIHPDVGSVDTLLPRQYREGRDRLSDQDPNKLDRECRKRRAHVVAHRRSWQPLPRSRCAQAIFLPRSRCAARLGRPPCYRCIDIRFIEPRTGPEAPTKSIPRALDHCDAARQAARRESLVCPSRSVAFTS